MQKILSTDIHIEASPEKVWQVLTDFEKFAEWNPFIIKAKGKAEIGTVISVTMQPPGKKAMTFTPRIIKLKPGKTFVWIGHLWFRGIFDGEHIFELIENADGSTRLIHGEKFRGILVGMLSKMIDENTKAGFIAMNEALKKRCETT